MLKLYKRMDHGILYWEAWDNGKTITVHTGTVGELGETEDVRVEVGEEPDEVIEREAAASRRDGYVEIDSDRLRTVIVQYRVAGWGSEEDLEKRYRVEGILNECLGWTGNGHCDGGDIGSGTINACAYVVDPDLSVETIKVALSESDLLDGAIIAIETEEGYKVQYPSDHQEDFSV